MNAPLLSKASWQPIVISRLRMSTTAATSARSDGNGGGGAYTAEEYRRNPDHVAKTRKGEEEDSYILALFTDHDHHRYLTGFRDRYFPKEINKLEAHVALFRALPGSELPKITEDISQLCKRQQTFKILADRPFRMSHGIGIHVKAGPAEKLFQELKSSWGPFLSKQDQSFRAHYTIQNKVDDGEQVEKALEDVKKEFKRSEGTVTGLTLYRYVKGFWKDGKTFRFEGNGS